MCHLDGSSRARGFRLRGDFDAARGDGIVFVARNIYWTGRNTVEWGTLFRIQVREVVALHKDTADRLTWTDTEGMRWTFQPLTPTIYNREIRSDSERKYRTKAALDNACREAFDLVH